MVWPSAETGTLRVKWNYEYRQPLAESATERSGRLKRVEERVRSVILMQVDGDGSPMVAPMRADLEAQAQAERVVVAELQAQADAPIRLPPVELITERVLALKALTESDDVEGAEEHKNCGLLMGSPRGSNGFEP